MKSRLFAVSAVVLSIASTGASAAVFIQSPQDILCRGDSCSGVQRGLGASTPITIDSFSFRRELLGELGNQLVHITFWTNGGQTLAGDFGDYSLSVLAGDVLTLKGPGFTLDPGAGDLTFRIDRVDLSGGGGAGGGWGGGYGAAASSGLHLALGTRNDDAGEINAPDGPSVGPNLLRFAAVTSAVPEATSWALMVLGFGGLGATLRSRRHQAAGTV